MRGALERINGAEAADAESMFLDCCGSTEWARRMTAARPFASDEELMNAAAEVWNELEIPDWLEAFSAHPKIGDNKADVMPGRSAAWSADEQAGVGSADEHIRRDLAEANRRYLEKFGFIYIVFATGKSATEMLDLCRRRVENNRETELAIAAGEQQKITAIRLRKLLTL